MTTEDLDRVTPAGQYTPRPPRRQIAFSFGNWQITFTGTNPRSPRTGTLAGRTEFGPRGVRVPVIADDSPTPSVSWVDDHDVIAVTAPPAGEPRRRRRPRTGGGRHRAL
jgi:hypothetical protein